MTLSFDSLDVDSYLQVLSFIHIQGLARMATCSRLGSVVAHEAQQRPSLLVLKGSMEEIARDLREHLASKPTVAFYSCCQPNGGDGARLGETMFNFVRKILPSSTVILGGLTESLQCAANSFGKTELCIEPDGECHGLLLATLPEASARVFFTGHANPSTFLDDAFDSDYSDYDMFEGGEDEAFSGEELEDDLGIHAPRTPDGLEQESTDGGYPGNALSAIMTDVSRIQGSQTTDNHISQDNSSSASNVDGNATTSNSNAVGASNANETGEACNSSNVQPSVSTFEECFNLDPPPQVIVVYVGGAGQSTIKKLQDKYPEAAIIGGVVMGQQVIGSSKVNTFYGRGTGIMTISGNAPLFAMTCPYPGSSPVAEELVRRKLAFAAEKAAAEEQKVLGALLFTCNGRGRSMFGREGSDAKFFHAQFPSAPFLGWYAGGEVGPAIDREEEARAIEGRFTQSDKTFLRGNARLQGFTAIYGFFLVPQKFVPSSAFLRAVLNGEVSAAFKAIYDARGYHHNTCIPCC